MSIATFTPPMSRPSTAPWPNDGAISAHSRGPWDESELYRFSVEQYERAVVLGIFEGCRVELLDGLLVSKMPDNPLHATVTELVAELLRKHIPRELCVRSEKPIRLSESEPEPDVAVVKGSLRDFVARHPQPRDAILVVEVADSSLGRDRGPKVRIYSDAGLRAYWIVDVQARSVAVYEREKDGSLILSVVKQATESIDWSWDGTRVLTLPVADMLP